jgi:DNA-directed RNA polymerase specialized sigma24 family protein
MRNGIIESIRHRNRKKRTAEFCKLNYIKWQEVPEKQQTQKDSAYETMQQICKTLIENHPEDTPQDRIDKTILSEVYVQGKNVSAVAKKNKITRVTVYNRLRRIIKKIQKQHSDLIYLHREILE